MWTKKNDKADGDGFVGDIHDIAFNVHLNYPTKLLLPL